MVSYEISEAELRMACSNMPVAYAGVPAKAAEERFS